MSAAGGPVPGLSGAAEALETELRRYEELVEAIRTARLDSEKGLRRASQTLVQLQACDVRLAELAQALVAAVGAAGTRQQALAETVRACAVQIGERSTTLTTLLGHWEQLGAAAAEVNNLVQQLTTGEESGPNGVERARALRTVDERLTGLADEAQLLGERAAGAEFPDLARQAESLRLQLLSAANKLRLALGEA